MNQCKDCKWFESVEWIIGAKSKNIDKWAKKLSKDGYGDCMNRHQGGKLGFSALVVVTTGRKLKINKHLSRRFPKLFYWTSLPAHLFTHESFGCIGWEKK